MNQQASSIGRSARRLRYATMALILLYELGVGFYVLCAVMIALSRRASLVGASAARPDKEPGLLNLDEADAAAASIAPSAQSAQAELAAAGKIA